MKKQIFTLMLLLSVLYVNGQYTFTTTMTTYQELINPTSLNQGNVWTKDDTYQIYFNFNFTVGNQTITGINVDAGGGINFPGLNFRNLFVFHTPFGGYLLKDKGSSVSKSSIDYEIVGSVGEKILKIQWKNPGFGMGWTTIDTSDFVDYQIWLFESDSHIELHFGNSSTSPGTYGFPEGTSDSNPGPGIRYWYESCSSVFGLTGPADLPSYFFSNECGPAATFIDGTPSNGIAYSIIPNATAVSHDMKQVDPVVFPNPTTNNIQILNLPEDNASYEISVTDIYGKMVLKPMTIVNNVSNISISLNDLNSGFYFIKLTGNSGEISTFKVIKKSP